LFSFLHANVFFFQNDNQRRDIEQFVLAFDTGIAPAVGLQVTVDAANKTSTPVATANSPFTGTGNRGKLRSGCSRPYNGAPRGFLYTGNGQYQTDKQGERSVSTAALLQAAGHPR